MKNKKPQCKKGRAIGKSKIYLKSLNMSKINNVAIFIVTYKTEDFLKENIKSILDSDIKKFVNNFTITVINNYHKKFDIEKEIKSYGVRVIHNYLRSCDMKGHLARNWNESIIMGFESVNNPKNDIVILCQDDTKFKQNWFENLLKHHIDHGYEWVMNGCGDQFQSFLGTSHIKKVGLYDERFNSIQWQEIDYQIRSIIYNEYKVSISDWCHNCFYNALGTEKDRVWLVEIGEKYCGYRRRTNDQGKSDWRYAEANMDFWIQKWGLNKPHGVDCDSVVIRNGCLHDPSLSLYRKIKSNGNKTVIKNTMLYPFFERECDLGDKNYIGWDHLSKQQ
jgi:hypothetical protein